MGTTCLSGMILWVGVVCGFGSTALAPQAGALAPTKQSDDSLAVADRIARLQSSLQTAKKQLEQFQTQLIDPASEYYQALKEYQDLDQALQGIPQKIQELLQSGDKAKVDEWQNLGITLQQRKQLAGQRLALAIEERKQLQQKVKTLPEQIRQNQQALDELLGQVPRPEEGKIGATGPKKHAGDNAEPNRPQKAKSLTPQTGYTLQPGTGGPANPGTLAPSSPAQASTLALPQAPAKPSAQDKVVKKARQDAEAREAAAKKAVQDVHSLAKRLKVIDQSITQDQARLQTASQQVDLYQKSIEELGKEQQQLLAAGKQDQASNLQKQIDQAKERLAKAQEEVHAINAGLSGLLAEQADLQKDEEQARLDAEQKKQAAEKAEQVLADLENPFSVSNILAWIVAHAPQVMAILLGMGLLHFLVRLFSRQIVRMFGHHGKRFTLREAENRARTLAGIFTNLGSLVVCGGGSLMILDAVGIPIVPLMGGAAVIGLAVAFGAQNLIRDYFTGFMVLLEDQYGINDVVKIGDVSGLVERISLRMTVLRDQEGVAHFIPHGTITTVSNLTHGWSVAMFKIAISYQEDVDAVMQQLTGLGRDLRQEPDFRPLILDDPEMLGVDSFDSTSVTIKFLVKTRPLMQWPVKRELLRRIKKRFDELGIGMLNSHHSSHPQSEIEPVTPPSPADPRDAGKQAA